LIGGSIGAVLALLFAPKSGADLRSDISDITRKGYDETLDLAHQLKEQSADVYQSIKEKTDKVYELAAEKFSLAKDAVDDSIEAAGQKINGEIRDIEDKAAQKTSPATGRRGSSIF
jgi:gas vesicle protein